MNVNNINSNCMIPNPPAIVVTEGYLLGAIDKLHAEIGEFRYQLKFSILEEREACAKICEDISDYEQEIREDCAAAIRARSKV